MQSATTSVNNTPTPESSAGRSSGAGRGLMAGVSIVMTILALGLIIAAVAAQLFFIPRAHAAFEDFDTELPSLTIVALGMSPLVPLAFGAVLCVLLILKEWLLKPGAIRIVLNLLVYLLLTVWVVFLVLAVLLPYVKLMQSVA